MTAAVLTPERAILRAEVVAAITDYIKSDRPPQKLRTTIVAQFPQIPRTTVYAWIKQALETGGVGKRLAETRVPMGTGEEVASIASLPMAEAINEAIVSIQGVLAYARGDDPKRPRNPRLTLSAALALTRSMETAMGLHQALVAARRLEDFNRALITEIQKESPELAQRVTDRLRALTSRLEV